MLTTIDKVKALTGYDVTLGTITMAQGIIETYMGKSEGDVENVGDLEVLYRATSYQAAYMHNNADKVFEQIGVKQITQTDGSMSLTYEQFSPFLAPLAVLAMDSLSWRGSRSVRTGPIFDVPRWGRSW